MKDVFHYPNFLERVEADAIYAKLSAFEWRSHNDGGFEGEPLGTSLDFGLSYQRNGGGILGEIPLIPGFLQRLADKVGTVSNAPCNYVQCHNDGPEVIVRPHLDPGDMVVPMLCVGQERDFRCGGKMPNNYYTTPQRLRDVHEHFFEQQFLMSHGSLLVFIGGNVIHSMLPAKEDFCFRENGFATRFSILFRYTTPSMRKFGPGKRATAAGTKEEYAQAVKQYLSRQRAIQWGAA